MTETTVKKYDLSGKESGKMMIPETLASAETSSQLVKDYIVAIRANKRQWSASTKTRAEVKHTTKKPYKQKGTGNARQGMLVTPQYRGGGIVFGPKPKFDQVSQINKKAKRAAVRTLLSEKIKENAFFVIDSLEMNAPKTKEVHTLLQSLNIDGRVLFLGESKEDTISIGDVEVSFDVRSNNHGNFAKSLRNIPKTKFSLAKNVNGYDLANARYVVATEGAVQELTKWLS